MFSKLKNAVSGAALSFLAVPTAFATGTTIDTTTVTDQVSANETAIVAVGGAVVAMAAIAVAFKWIKGMLFG